MSVRVFGFFLLSLSLRCGAESAIVIRPDSQVSQNKSIYLSDVAEFYDLNGPAATELGAVKLADGVMAGENIEFSGSEISSILRTRKQWQKLQPKPSVKIPSRVLVENIGDRVTEAQVRMELAQRWQMQCNCRVQLDDLIMPKIATWTPGSQWRLRLSAEPARGNFTVPLEITDPKSGQKTLWLKGRVAYFISAPVATRQLNMNDRLQAGDLTWVERDITFARDSLPKAQEIIGRRLRQGVSANQILFSGNLEREKALKRGDVVKVEVSSQGWEVTLMGIAEQDGFVGDRVKIRNAKSNQVLVATVVGQGEVKVE